MQLNKQVRRNLLIGTKSKSRKSLFSGLGLNFRYISANIDEEKILSDHKSLALEEQALFLAKAKACFLTSKYRNKYIICFDTTINLGKKTIFKSSSKKECLNILRLLNNRKHSLYSACVIMKDNKIITSNVDQAIITFKNNSEKKMKNYVNKYFNKIVHSVGCYNIESEGMDIIEKMEGSYFTVLGVPLFFLIEELSKLK